VLPKGEPISPLRYPGGKSSLSGYIADVLEANLLTSCTLYEPYVGGGSVSLDLLERGYITRAVWLEKDPLVFAFWHSLINNGYELYDEVEALDVSIETWSTFQSFRKVTELPENEEELLRLGIAGLFFNRTNFSGILKAGPIGGRQQLSNYPIDCRFKKVRILNLIKYLYEKFSQHIEIHYGDAVSFLENHHDEINDGFSFVYLDPPYYKEGKNLYRYYYQDVDHTRLARHISHQEFPWLISYDDDAFIRELYRNNEIQQIYLDYTIKSSRKGMELLISNLEIPPPVYEKLGIIAA
jgi:DNA adenine methylase